MIVTSAQHPVAATHPGAAANLNPNNTGTATTSLIPRIGKREFKNALFDRLKAWKKGEPSTVVVGGVPSNIFDATETIEFPSDLTPAERRIVHQLCLRLDLFHASKGEGESRRVTISKSVDFFETFSLEQEHEQRSATSGDGGDALDAVGGGGGGAGAGAKSSSSVWYDERASKPAVTGRYFDMSEKDIRRLQEKVEGIASVEPKVTVQLRGQVLQMDDAVETGSASSSSSSSSSSSGSGSRSAAFARAMGLVPGPEADTEDVAIPTIVVDTPELLRTAGAALRSCHELSFDLEMHSFRSYHGLTCLIQLSGGGTNYLVDPLAPSLWRLVPEVLGPIFSDPRIIKIGHGVMGGDVPALFRDFGIVIVNAFDTQEASACLGRGGLGLAALLEQWGCPSKREVASLKEQMKHTDWRLRPMTPLMLRYAVLDVHYLIPLYRLMVRELLVASMNTGWKDALGLIAKEREHVKRMKKAAKDSQKPKTEKKGPSAAAAAVAGKGDAKAAPSPAALPSTAVAVHLHGSGGAEEGHDDPTDAEVWGAHGGGGADDDAPSGGGGGGGGGSGGDGDSIDYNAVLREEDLAGLELNDDDGDDDDDDLWDGWGGVEQATAPETPAPAKKKESPSPSPDKEAAGLRVGMWDIARSQLSRSNSCVSNSNSDLEASPSADRENERPQKTKKRPAAVAAWKAGRQDDAAPAAAASGGKHGGGNGGNSLDAHDDDNDAEDEGEGGQDDDDADVTTTRSNSFDAQSFPTAAALTSLTAGAGSHGGDTDDAVAARRRLLDGVVRDYGDATGTVTLRSSDLQSDPRLSEFLAALAASQRSCAKLWAPKRVPESAYTKVSGFSQRKRFNSARGGAGPGRWDQRSLYVFRKLFFWREREAQDRDESPAFICPSSLLLDAAEYLPDSLVSLSKLQSPLPPSMRPLGPSAPDSARPPVDLVAAIKVALEGWEGHLRKLSLGGNSGHHGYEDGPWNSNNINDGGDDDEGGDGGGRPTSNGGSNNKSNNKSTKRRAKNATSFLPDPDDSDGDEGGTETFDAHPAPHAAPPRCEQLKPV